MCQYEQEKELSKNWGKEIIKAVSKRSRSTQESHDALFMVDRSVNVLLGRIVHEANSFVYVAESQVNQMA